MPASWRMRQVRPSGPSRRRESNRSSASTVCDLYSSAMSGRRTSAAQAFSVYNSASNRLPLSPAGGVDAMRSDVALLGAALGG
eukprot:scaffold3665_cov244-Pinguiococcus_pyrenoidosus.AAC.9